MSKWTKRGKYYATNGQFIMSWNDVKKFTLYQGETLIEHGTRAECLSAFNNSKSSLLLNKGKK